MLIDLARSGGARLRACCRASELNAGWGINAVSNTEKKIGADHQPNCMMAHTLINKMSVIIGHCDLMAEQEQMGSPQRTHLGLIRDIARTMTEELREHQLHSDSPTPRATGADHRHA